VGATLGLRISGAVWNPEYGVQGLMTGTDLRFHGRDERMAGLTSFLKGKRSDIGGRLFPNPPNKYRGTWAFGTSSIELQAKFEILLDQLLGPIRRNPSASPPFFRRDS